MASGLFQPPVEWAQRKDTIYLTIGVEDGKDLQVDLADDKFHFRGRGGPDKREFECTIEFYKEVDSNKARRVPSDRNIQYVVPKKESGPFWPRLLKTEKKMHWVKIDFNKWKDEDDLSEEEGAKFDFNDMMGQMGGMSNFGARPDLEDLEDSDNEELPDLEDDKEKDKEHEDTEVATTATDDKKGEHENKVDS